MKKILVLSKYGMRAASTRYRFAQYFPVLHQAGYAPEISPLLDDAYLEAQYEGRSDPQAFVRGLVRRIHDLWRAGDFQLGLLNYEAFPYLPALYERLLALRLPFVLDIDDAIFHRYDQGPLAPFLGGKIAAVAGQARLAIAGNAYLATHLRRKQRDVRVIPTVVNTDLYLPKAKGSNGPVVVGWIGSPSTVHYLEQVLPALREVCDGKRAHLVVVGAGRSFRSPGAELRDWMEEREVADIQDFDIGIMPLKDDPWSRGKCGFKLIQYMACGLPVVASPVGVNGEIIARGKTGELAGDLTEWKSAVSRLVESRQLRQQMGALARGRAVNDYSLTRWSWPFVRAVSDAARF